ncbi:MAG: Bcr/CflA family drug resistance efflux transporter [Zetaproteobacteria bacterium]|nr:Bcr/CflA family drug resistance efflux transporter [Pseudobdellovibrionaceae bacterium]
MKKSELTQTSTGEFVAMSALMMALIALAIDAMLPALPDLGKDLNVSHPNDAQLVVSMVFLGMAIGQVFFGPLSDSIGRKSAVYIGYVIFFIGSICSIVTDTFALMIIGRILQGIGLGGARTICIALIRDQFVGDAMAKVMSYIMAVFVLAPMIAPALGQGILLIGNWRWIFTFILGLSVVSLVWFLLRQPETLSLDKRSRFSIVLIWSAASEAVRNPITIGFTIALGFILGAFIGYLSSVQQIMQIQYALGSHFPIVFAVCALSVGLASLLNGKLVLYFGMLKLCKLGILGVTVTSIIFFGANLLNIDEPPLWSLILYFMITLFFVGLQFGNLNALAMQPLGHIAGVGSSVVGFISSVLSVPIGILIGALYDDSVMPVVVGFASLGLLATVTIFWIVPCLSMSKNHSPS